MELTMKSVTFSDTARLYSKPKQGDKVIDELKRVDELLSGIVAASSSIVYYAL